MARRRNDALRKNAVTSRGFFGTDGFVLWQQIIIIVEKGTLVNRWIPVYFMPMGTASLSKSWNPRVFWRAETWNHQKPQQTELGKFVGLFCSLILRTTVRKPILKPHVTHVLQLACSGSFNLGAKDKLDGDCQKKNTKNCERKGNMAAWKSFPGLLTSSQLLQSLDSFPLIQWTDHSSFISDCLVSGRVAVHFLVRCVRMGHWRKL